MSKPITVVYCRMDEVPMVLEIEHTLERMQELVGGLIQPVVLSNGINLICNEEYELLELPFHLEVEGHRICGDFFLCRSDDEGSFTSIGMEGLMYIRRVLDDASVPGWRLDSGCHRGTLLSRDSSVMTHLRDGSRKLASLEDCTTLARHLRDGYEALGCQMWYATAIDPDGGRYPIKEPGMHNLYY